MTGVERNAKCHTSSRLSLKTEPFWNLPSALFSWMHASSQLKNKKKKKTKVTPWRSQMFWLCATWLVAWTPLCLHWMLVYLPPSSASPASLWCMQYSLWTGIRQRYSKPGANTKHLDVKSVISIPKSLNIEIRSSVQQRPIFTLIYHGYPCTRALITPYMVNKPLTCSRQCVVFTQRQRIYCTATRVSQCLCFGIIQVK